MAPFATGGTATAAGATGSLAGAQRSMVDSIAYVFSEPVNLAAGAFTIGLYANVSVNGVSQLAGAGTLPTLNWATPDGGATWVVTFSGAGVIGNSIADGVYDITLNNLAVAPVSGGNALPASRTDNFFRLFGDSNGDDLTLFPG